MITPHNLFDEIPSTLPDEVIELLHERAGVRVERILSRGHASPDGFWYDQDRDEFVLLLKGAARLRFLEPDESVSLTPGDHVTITAHRRHRLEWTTPEELSIWLAVHL